MADPRFEEGTVWPDYQGRCLSNVPSTLMSILGVEDGKRKLDGAVFEGVDTTGIQNVVLFLFDGLGLTEWQRQVGDGFLARMGLSGRVSPLTTVFPSTTSTALTSLVTGLTPEEHSLIEWFLYLKEADMLIQTLPFSPMGPRGGDALRKVDPRVLFNGEPIFARMKSQRVASHSYIGRQIARSEYSRLVHADSLVHPYFDGSDLTVSLRKTLEAAREPSFHYVYWSGIDTIEHFYGPGSEESFLEASNISGALATGLLSKLDPATASRTLFVVTADHGHVYSPTTETHWLDSLAPLHDSLARSPAGMTIPPWGSPRDVYLRVDKDRLDEVHDYLVEKLASIATVVKSSEAVDRGLFGTGTPTATFLERVGNLMLLPKDKRSAWFHYSGVEPLKMTGQHGGMHRDEMTIPLAIARAASVHRA